MINQIQIQIQIQIDIIDILDIVNIVKLKLETGNTIILIILSIHNLYVCTIR